MNRRWFYCILFIVTCLKANGQRLRHANSHLEKFANLPELKSSSISICFRNVKTGKIVASLDEDRRLIPASTIKLVTTATVLSAAGENFRYHTQFSLRGIKKEDSTFEGNIEIRGSGDPSFGSGSFVATPRVEQIADTLSILLRNEGIAKINGGILIDHSFITDVPENPEWLYYDIANYYGAGVFGFNVLENTAFISLEKRTRVRLAELPIFIRQKCRPILETMCWYQHLPLKKRVFIFLARHFVRHSCSTGRLVSKTKSI